MIIGLGYKARSGKDTVGNHLVENYGFQRLSFADQLKLFCEVNFGMKEKDPRLLQEVGMNFRQNDPGHWIKKVANIVERSPKEHYVITDVRFKNEFFYIKENGGVVWDIQRWIDDENSVFPNVVKRYISDDRPKDHPSEIDLDGVEFDLVLLNCGTKEDLYNWIDIEMSKLQFKKGVDNS